MRVHVDQARRHDEPGAVDDLCVARLEGTVTDRGDPPSLDEDVPDDIQIGRRVDDPAAPQEHDGHSSPVTSFEPPSIR